MLARRAVPARDLGAQDGGGGEAFKSAGAARSVPNKKPPLPTQLTLPRGQVEGDPEVGGRRRRCHHVGTPGLPAVPPNGALQWWGGAAAQRAAGLAEIQQLSTAEHAQQPVAKRAMCGEWLAALDTWAQHCRLQQSQLHCSLDWQANPPTCKQYFH